MRIRKNAKLFSSILPSHASSAPETLQTHVCQLNQSPWDVVPLEYSCPCPSLNYQFEGEDSFTGNGSFGDSMVAVESVASMMGGEENNKAQVMLSIDDEMVIDDDNGNNIVFDSNKLMEDQFGLVVVGDNNDYKTTTRCRNEPGYGHDLCDHHSSSLQQQQLKSYNYNDNTNNNVSNHGTCASSVTNSNKKHDKTVAAASASCSRPRGRGRARVAANKKGSSSNPYEFYYYSGFGPSWGKRRGDRVIEEAKNKCEDNNIPGNDHKTTSSSSSSQIENGVFDFVDDDDDDEDDCGKKRMRKPVKARSLKSLM